MVEKKPQVVSLKETYEEATATVQATDDGALDGEQR